MHYFKLGIKRGFDFHGRSSRKEFWYFFLFAGLATPFLLGIVDKITGSSDNTSSIGLLEGIYLILIIVPLISVNVRRLHDTNRSGWLILMPYISASLFGALVLITIGDESGIIAGLCLLVVGNLVIFCFCALPSNQKENRFGAIPTRSITVDSPSKEVTTSSIVIKDEDKQKQEPSDGRDKVVEPSEIKPTIYDDSRLFLEATQEANTGKQEPALWAKAMALCDGDDKKAKYKYINMRVDGLANAVKQEVTPHSIQSSTLEHDAKDTDSELSLLFLKEKGFNVTQKDNKWAFIDASGESREFSTKGLVALANSKGFSDSFKENKLAEINLQRSKKFLKDKGYLVIKKNYGWLIQGGLENIVRLKSDDELFAYAVKNKGFRSAADAKYYLKNNGFIFNSKDYGWQVLEPGGGIKKITTDDEMIIYANSKELPL